nr:zinc finger, CCHC-type [Tanacetum cinerariifolium]
MGLDQSQAFGSRSCSKGPTKTLRSELETPRIKPNKKVSDFGGKLSSIMAKFKGLGETLEDKVLVRKLLNSAPKKFLPIMATIEQYQDLDEMSFEEVVERLTAYEERIKSQDTLEANDQDKLLMSSLNNKLMGNGEVKISTKKARKALNGRIIQIHAEQVQVKELKTKASSGVMNVVSMDTLQRNARNGNTRRKTKSKKHISSMTLTLNLHYFEDKSRRSVCDYRGEYWAKTQSG